METTYIMVKPDGVQRGLVGEIIGRFERKGLKLVGLKSMVPTEEIARTHYDVHKERPFYNDLVEYMTSGPVQIQVLSGDSAIDANRAIMGATNPAEAEAGSIRADFADSIEENIVHGSDGPDTATQEIAFFFSEDEICNRTR